MSIENAILELAKAINRHADAMFELNKEEKFEAPAAPVVEVEKPKRKSKAAEAVVTATPALETIKSPEVKDEFEELDEAPAKVVEVTHDAVLQYARSLIAKGKDRSEVKKIIAAHGAEAVSELAIDKLPAVIAKLIEFGQK